MAKIENELYFVVLPMIHMGQTQFGVTEDVLTLMPDINFATRFFPNEVDGFVATFRNRLKHMVGGHVQAYDIYKDELEDGRLVVRVVQYVE
jgi:hypothetical protein